MSKPPWIPQRESVSYDGAQCGEPLRSDPEKKCYQPAGRGTEHNGWGPCVWHVDSKVERAWRLGMEIANRLRVDEQLNVSPWDAILVEVRRTAGRIAWVDQQLSEAVERAELNETLVLASGDPDSPEYREAVMEALPANDPRVDKLLRTSRAERRHLAIVAKAAIDAGVAERLVRNIEMEGTIVANAVMAGLDRLPFLTDEQKAMALAAAHAKLLALDISEPTVVGDPVVIEGQLALPSTNGNGNGTMYGATE